MNDVTWYHAAAYCNWLSRQENLPRVLRAQRAGKYAEGMRIQPDALKLAGYRLPTEAEWEYACRSGAVTSRYYGSSIDLLGRYAWYQANTKDHAWSCGSLLPNDLGLFDMLGNVYEWCQDVVMPTRSTEAEHLIRVPPYLYLLDDTNPRLLRGGSYLNGPSTSARRSFSATPRSRVSSAVVSAPPGRAHESLSWASPPCSG